MCVLCRSVRLATTVARADRELLIDVSSLIRSLPTSCSGKRSEPARSTRLSLDVEKLCEFGRTCCFSEICRMLWLWELPWFISVPRTSRWRFPFSMTLIRVDSDGTSTSVSPAMNTSCPSSRISSPAFLQWIMCGSWLIVVGLAL